MCSAWKSCDFVAFPSISDAMWQCTGRDGRQDDAQRSICEFWCVAKYLKLLSSDLWPLRMSGSPGGVPATFLPHITFNPVYSQYYSLRPQEGYMGDFTSKYSAHPQQVSPTGGRGCHTMCTHTLIRQRYDADLSRVSVSKCSGNADKYS